MKQKNKREEKSQHPTMIQYLHVVVHTPQEIVRLDKCSNLALPGVRKRRRKKTKEERTTGGNLVMPFGLG